MKRIGKERDSYIFFVYITFTITGGGLLVIFDIKKTTFRNKNYRFIFYVKKNRL